MSNKRERLDEEGLSNDELIRIVQTVASMRKSMREKRKYCQETYPDFVDRYPMLYEKACDDNFDMNRFMYMMGLRSQIANKTHTVDSASAEVGQALFDVYVKPIVDASKEKL